MLACPMRLLSLVIKMVADTTANVIFLPWATILINIGLPKVTQLT